MSVTFYCNTRNNSVMFDTFDTWVQLNNPLRKKDKKKRSDEKHMCVEVWSNLECQNLARTEA